MAENARLLRVMTELTVTRAAIDRICENCILDETWEEFLAANTDEGWQDNLQEKVDSVHEELLGEIASEFDSWHDEHCCCDCNRLHRDCTCEEEDEPEYEEEDDGEGNPYLPEDMPVDDL